MNPLLHWLTSPEWTHVVSALLHSLWQGAIIALALAVLMRRLTNPVTRYRCSLGALGGLFIASLITWAVLNAPQSAASKATLAPATNSVAAPSAMDTFDSNASDKVVVIAQMSRPEAQPHWTAWLALAWMLGALAMLLRVSIKVAGAENLRRSCQPLKDEAMILLVAEACRAVDLARKIRVAVTDKLTSPAVVGVLVPTLILPLSLFSALTPEQIRFVLLHELAHIRRGDYLANLFQLFAEALLFFNPAVWWISHQIRREREACCDALAIELSGAPADYAKTLVRVAENILQPTTNAALAFGEDGREPSSLADRVQRLLVPGYRPALRLTWRAMLTSLLVGGALLILSAVGTRNTVGAILTSNQPTSSPVLLGPRINQDAQPRVSGDDSNIQTPIIPTLTEFVSYDLATAATFVPTPVTGTGQRIDSVLPLPIFRVRQLTTSNKVGNGQTNVLGGLHSDNIARIKDKVPFLGDLPLLGKLFGSETSTKWFHGDDSFTMTNWTSYAGAPMEIIPLGTANGSFAADESGEKIVFANGAVVRFNNQTLTADYVEVNHKTGDLVARGNARLETINGTHSGKVIEVNLRSNLVSGTDYRLTFPKHTISSAGAFIPTLSGEVQTGIFDAYDWTLGGQNQTNQRSFWYRTGGQTRTTQVPATGGAIPSEPLVTRTFEVDVNSFRAAVRKAAGLPETVATTNLGVGFRTFFAQAGVNLDPQLGKSFFFSSSRGDMQIRATKDDLDIIEKLLKPLAGIPLSLGNFQISPQTLANAQNSLASEISSILTTNPAAGFRVLLESFDPTDPRPKRVHYNPDNGELQARATEADLQKFASVLNVSRVTNSIAKTLTSRETALTTNLVTRTFQIKPSAMIQAIESQFPKFNPLTATNFTDSIRALLESSGANLAPPKSIYYNDRAGGLFIRATKEDLDTIEALLRVIGQEPPQVNIKAVFVEIPFGKAQPKELAKILGPIIQANATNFTGILTALQFKAVLRALEKSSSAKFLAMPQVTTLSGRQAQIQVTDVKTIVSGMTAVVTNGMTKLRYQSQAMPFGPVLDVLPTVSGDGYTIQMTLIPTFTEFLGYEDAKKLKLSSPDDKATLPLPVFRTRQMTTSASVWDGQTIVLGNFSDEMLAAPSYLKNAPKTPAQRQSKQLLVFVTPTIIDPAGNPVHAETKTPPTSR